MADNVALIRERDHLKVEQRELAATLRGISPKVSLYQKTEARMQHISTRLAEIGAALKPQRV